MHISVLLEEAMTALAIQPDGTYIDATFGRGGHSAAILSRLSDNGRLIAIDRDPEAVAFGQRKFANDPRFSIHHANFESLAEVAREIGVVGGVDGVLLDLGVSSPQLDTPERGFSFLRDGPLDMRMDPSTGESAADWLARASVDEIADVLWRFGEERFSRRIARAIVEARDRGIHFERTRQLAELIEKTVPKREPGKHPATRSFQAIRIWINDELSSVERALHSTLEVLAPAGRLVVISFHSLEDRMVKRFMREQSRGPQHPRGLPIQEASKPALSVIGKAIRATDSEIEKNPRARSAVMRVAEKRGAND